MSDSTDGGFVSCGLADLCPSASTTPLLRPCSSVTLDQQRVEPSVYEHVIDDIPLSHYHNHGLTLLHKSLVVCLSQYHRSINIIMKPGLLFCFICCDHKDDSHIKISEHRQLLWLFFSMNCPLCCFLSRLKTYCVTKPTLMQ